MRGLLGKWRAMNHNPKAFTHCTECQFEYKLAFFRKEGGKALIRKIRLRIARDTLFMFLMIQTIIAVLGFIIRVCDSNEVLHPFSWYFSQNEIAGIISLTFVLGISFR